MVYIKNHERKLSEILHYNKISSLNYIIHLNCIQVFVPEICIVINFSIN